MTAAGWRRHGDYLALSGVLLLHPVLTLPRGSAVAGALAAGAALGAAWLGQDGSRRRPGARSGPAERTDPRRRLSSLLLAGGAATLAPQLPAPWWPPLLLLLVAGLAGCTEWPAWERVARAARRAGALSLAASLLAGPFTWLMAMLDTWPPAGWAALLLGRIAGLDLSLSGDSLVVGTPLEHQPFPLAPEWTGLPLLAVLWGQALWWHAASREGSRPLSLLRRAPVLLFALALVQLWLGALFLGLSQWGAATGFYELPWHPLTWILGGLPALWLAHLAIPPAPPAPAAPREPRHGWRGAADLALGGLALALLLAGWWGEDAGRPKAGRVLIDDGHSDWEWVESPMTPDDFGSKSTYTFHGLGRLLSMYHELSVTREPLSAKLLSGTDVLVLKTPTRPYEREEISAVLDFVRAGGGLYLISDHTDIFGMSTWLNEVAAPLGLHFNADAVFALWTRDDQTWRPGGPLPHPAAAGLDGYHFLTSCSIRPGWRARPVMAGADAGSSLVCYHESNFFNPHPPRAEHRFGRIIQMAAVKVGRGRVLGFTDSTTYSNFAVFWPGRLEQVLAALDWLNRRNSPLPWTWISLGAGLLLLAWLAWRRRPAGGELLALGLLAAALLLPWLRRDEPRPLPAPRRLLPQASLDASLSQVHLPLMNKAEPADPGNFESFFIWLHRSGRLPVVSTGGIPAGSDLHVILNPGRVPDATEQAEQRRFVEAGGTLLVALRPSQFTPGLDAWLSTYGLGLGARLVQQETAVLPETGDSLWVDEGLEVRGGRPFAADGLGHALATETTVGKGRVVLSGLSDCFTNAHLGSYDSVPAGLALDYLRCYYRHVGMTLAADARRPRPGQGGGRLSTTP